MHLALGEKTQMVLPTKAITNWYGQGAGPEGCAHKKELDNFCPQVSHGIQASLWP